MSNEELETRVRKLGEALKVREEELEQTRKNASGGWITSCQWPLTGVRSINVQTCDEQMLVRLMADLIIQFDGLDAAAKEFGWTQFEAKIENFSRSQWKQDMHKRSAMISLRGREQKVAAMRLRLAGVTSEEERRRQEIEALTAEIESF